MTRGPNSAQASPAGRRGSAQRHLRAGVTGAAGRAVCRKHRPRMEAEPERAEAQRRGRSGGVSGPRLRCGRCVARGASWPLTVAGRERVPVSPSGGSGAFNCGPFARELDERGREGLGAGLRAGTPHLGGLLGLSVGTTAVLDFCGTPQKSEKG